MHHLLLKFKGAKNHEDKGAENHEGTQNNNFKIFMDLVTKNVSRVAKVKGYLSLLMILACQGSRFKPWAGHLLSVSSNVTMV